MSSSPPSNPPFTPLFTHLTTHHPNGSSTTSHPTTHYLFSDDNSAFDQLTTAALSTLSTSSPHERHLIVDLDATGAKVVSARSMSSEWAVTGAEVREAATWGEKSGEGAGLMLRVEGVEARAGARGKEEEERDLEALVERYRKGLEGLKRVVEAGREVDGMDDKGG